jgi:ACS family tartrate transporter-like MFS transporter
VGATLAVSAVVTLMLSRQSKQTAVAVEERHGH